MVLWDTDTFVRNIPICGNLISLVQTHDSNIVYVDVNTAFPNPKVDDAEMYIILPTHQFEGLKLPAIVVQLKNALYGVKQPPQLWCNNINTLLLSPGFTQSQGDLNP